MADVNLFHLYPDQLNLYGDRGNILALSKRALWRGLELNIIAIQPGDHIDLSKCDLLFMGGGQDSDQQLIARDLESRRDELADLVEKSLPVFAVCGSYQLLGNYYITSTGDKIKGLEILNIYTEAGQNRLIGNAVVNCHLWQEPKTLVGFENHAGRTYLKPPAEPLGTVLNGYGNNGRDNTEGAVYKNVIGTYLHGALLPKNPWLTDFLLQRALSYRNKDHSLDELNDTLEIQAHMAAIELASSKKHKRLSAKC